MGLPITFDDFNDFGRDCDFEGRGKECDSGVDPEGGASMFNSVIYANCSYNK